LPEYGQSNPARKTDETLVSETPSSKPQAPEKFQNTKPQKLVPGQTASGSVFELGAWSFFGAWVLEFGACCLALRPRRFAISESKQSALQHTDFATDFRQFVPISCKDMPG